MRVKPIRWPETPVPCFHCGLDMAQFEAELDYRGAEVNQCLCNICADLPDEIILAKALKKEVKP